MKAKKSFLTFLMLVFAFCIAGGFARPVIVQAAANKLMKVDLSFKNSKAANRFRGAEFFATPLKPDKLAKKKMTISGKVYIPVKAFKKADDEVMITPELSLWKFPPIEENNNAGIIYCKYDFILKYTGKKIVTYKFDGDKRTKAGKYAAVKKEGDYYLVTIKNAPINGMYLDETDKEATIPTGKKFILNAGFGIFSSINKAWKGTLCADDIKVKSASKTQTVTFNKKDYQGTFATNWASGGEKEATISKK